MVNKDQQQSDSNSPNPVFTPPTIKLPKGGGAIRGIGEKFAAYLVTYARLMTVSIAANPIHLSSRHSSSNKKF